MKNVVTFETAKWLKESGFVQPVPEFGQVWYGINGAQCLCIGNVFIDKFHNRWTVLDVLRFVFAPTATDILEQLPNRTYKIGYIKRDDAEDIAAWLVDWTEAVELVEAFAHEYLVRKKLT